MHPLTPEGCVATREKSRDPAVTSPYRLSSSCSNCQPTRQFGVDVHLARPKASRSSLWLVTEDRDTGAVVADWPAYRQGCRNTDTHSLICTLHHYSPLRGNAKICTESFFPRKRREKLPLARMFSEASPVSRARTHDEQLPSFSLCFDSRCCW